MKKISIITLTRQNSLAYAALKRIVLNLGYEPLCGEAIGADCIFFPVEEIHLVGYDFLADFFQKAGFSDADVHLISAPYTVNLLTLPKVIHCLRSVNPAPIILGGNEASNNYKNMMQYRSAAFVNQVVDVAPDFIVRGSAETALYRLLPLLDKKTMAEGLGIDGWTGALVRALAGRFRDLEQTVRDANLRRPSAPMIPEPASES